MNITEREIDRECELYGFSRLVSRRRIEARRMILRENAHRTIPLVSAQVVDVSTLPEFQRAAEHLKAIREKDCG